MLTALRNDPQSRRWFATSNRPFPRPVAPLIPRVGGVSYGPDETYFHSSHDPRFRAIHNTLSVMQTIDGEGYRSGAARAGAAPHTTAPSNEELVAYSNGPFRQAPWVGVNADAAYTRGVAERTGANPSLVDPATRVDEMSLDGLQSHSVEAGFDALGVPNRHPVHREEVIANQIPAANLRHTAVVPHSHPAHDAGLGQPGQVHPDYNRNIGQMLADEGAAPGHGINFEIATDFRPHPLGKGPPIAIDAIKVTGPRKPWEQVVAENKAKKRK